jgi:hypothetical protein
MSSRKGINGKEASKKQDEKSSYKKRHRIRYTCYGKEISPYGLISILRLRNNKSYSKSTVLYVLIRCYIGFFTCQVNK